MITSPLKPQPIKRELQRWRSGVFEVGEELFWEAAEVAGDFGGGNGVV
jgi:hypothetical protein